jgi:hypothetical protein
MDRPCPPSKGEINGVHISRGCHLLVSHYTNKGCLFFKMCSRISVQCPVLSGANVARTFHVPAVIKLYEIKTARRWVGLAPSTPDFIRISPAVVDLKHAEKRTHTNNPSCSHYAKHKATACTDLYTRTRTRTFCIPFR